MIPDRNVYQGEERVIHDNNKLGSEQDGMSVDDLKQLVMFYRTRLFEIKKDIRFLVFARLDAFCLRLVPNIT